MKPKGTAGVKTDLTVTVDVPDSAQDVDLVRNPAVIMVDMKPSSESQTMKAKQINGDMKEYKAAQFHFHAPSEHTINGKQYDLCIHTVNLLTSTNTDNGRGAAVLGYLFEEDAYAPDMPWLKQIIDAIPKTDGTVRMTFDWEKFSEWVPVRGRYWHYEGGLTTPGCGEIVNWHIN